MTEADRALMGTVAFAGRRCTAVSAVSTFVVDAGRRTSDEDCSARVRPSARSTEIHARGPPGRLNGRRWKASV